MGMSSEPSTRRAAIAMLASIAAISAGSCNARGPVTRPVFPDGGMLRDAAPLSDEGLSALQGFFDVGDGEDLFGAHVASRASPRRLSFFGPTDGAYSILEAGCLEGGEELVLEGYWRHAPSTDTGLVRLFAGPRGVARALCKGEAVNPSLPITFTGVTGTGTTLPDAPISFRFSRPLAPMARTFVTIAHHGTQTIEDYGASENTVEGFRIAEAMGAMAIEIDVRLTKDGVPLLFHDATFTSRLVEGRFCQGSVADLTLAQVRATCRNKYGEKIYTLEEGLEGALDQTTLGGAWVDVKVPEAVAPTLAVIQRIDARAAAKGRPWVGVIGLADEAMVAAYRAAKPPPGTRCILEYDPAAALSLGCRAWGPRFTEGPQPEAVADAQSKGLAVVFWTVDGASFIQQYLASKPNGMISDTPGLAFYFFQEEPWKPAGGELP